MEISVKGKYLLILMSMMLMLPMMAYADADPEPEPDPAKKSGGASWIVKNTGRKFNPRTGSYNRSYGSHSGGFRRIKAGNPHITEKMRISLNVLAYHTDNGPHAELWGKDKEGNSYLSGGGTTALNPDLWRPAITISYLLPACKFANWRFEGNIGYMGNKKPFNFQSIYVEPFIGANLYPSKKGGFYFTLGGSLYMSYIMENDHINKKYLGMSTDGSKLFCKDIAKGFGITPMVVGGLGCEWRVGKTSTIGLEGTLHIAVLDWKDYDGMPSNFALSMDGKTSNKDIWFMFVGPSGVVAPNFYAQLSLSYSFDLPTHRRAATYK